MSHREWPGRATSSESGHSGVAAVIAMLQSEHDQHGGSDGLKETKLTTSHEQARRKADAGAALEARTGEAIRSELELELLVLKRQRLIKLSKEVLETRCPGFCTQARLTEDEYLREASHALASITSDVEDAAYANGAIKAPACAS